MVVKNENVYAATVLGFLTAIAVQFDVLRDKDLGREGFMAKQSAYFDEYLAHPHWSLIGIFITAFLAALYLGIYELLVYFFNKLTNRSAKQVLED